MAKSIQVFDKLLPAALLSAVQEYFATQIRWQYGWPQGVNDPFTHWNHDVLETGLRNQEDMEHKLRGRPEYKPITDIWEVLRAGPLHGQILLRCYANAHTYGVEGYPHRDVEKDQIDNYTAVVYINPHWKTAWAGELDLFDAAGDTFFSVSPRPGRVAVIPGEFLHAARAVSRTCPAVRICLAFKSRLVN
jgi:hypothetical protein